MNWSLILVLMLAGCGEPNVNARSVPDFSMLAPCERPERADATSLVVDSLCGTITVFEDRERHGGRTIPLNVMVIPAVSAVARPDPIFFLAGGPGQAATELGPLLFMRLGELRLERDIVLVDQRGTGKSSPLNCMEDDRVVESMDLTLEQAEARTTAAMQKCLASYAADPRFYTTPVAMDDLDEVRATLGFETINLLGISYGTRAGFVYLQRHGNRVRSAIFDGVAPLSMPIPARIAMDAEAALRKLYLDCRKQPRCAKAFPDLELHFREVISRLREAPIMTSLQHPRTGELVSVRLTATVLTRLLRNVLYDRSLSALIPLAVEEAHQGDYQPLISLSLAFTGEASAMSFGMMASVLCSEDMPRTGGPGDLQLDFDNSIYRTLVPVCTFWPKGSIPASFYEPLTSAKPILLLSGQFDPVTPPAYAEAALATLSNARHIVVPGVGHGSVIHGCLPAILDEFLSTLNPAELDFGCVGDLQRPPFFTSLAGPVDPALAKAPRTNGSGRVKVVKDD